MNWIDQRKWEKVVLKRYSAMIRLARSVGCTASQNTYLSASLHVLASHALHVYPISYVPVPQHPTSAFTKPAVHPHQCRVVSCQSSKMHANAPKSQTHPTTRTRSIRVSDICMACRIVPGRRGCRRRSRRRRRSGAARRAGRRRARRSCRGARR